LELKSTHLDMWHSNVWHMTRLVGDVTRSPSFSWSIMWWCLWDLLERIGLV